MFFQIALGPNLPVFSVVVAESGQLFVKLIDIGILLKKKNPYEYRNRFKHMAVVARDVVPVRGFKIPYQTLTMHLVSMPVAFHLINEEKPDLGKSFLKCFSNGYACKFGMRKFVTSSRKSPMLMYMEERDEKSVYVPKWIEDFVKDLQLYRSEVLKEECNQKRKCERLDRKCKKRVSLDEESSCSLIIDDSFEMNQESSTEEPSFEIKQMLEAESISESEAESIQEPPFEIKDMLKVQPMPQAEEPPFEIKQEPEAESFLEPIQEPICRIEIKQEPTFVREPPFEIKQEPTFVREPPFEIKQEPTFVREPLFEIKPEPTFIQEPLFEIKKEPASPAPTETVPVAVVKLNTSGLLMNASGMFPGPGDLIVKFKNQPVRVWFIKGENDEMYHVIQ